MKYKNEEIGIPTLEMVDECCKMLKLAVPSVDVYNHYKKKNFLTNKKFPIKTLEAMCAAHNGVYLQNLRKKSQPNDPFYQSIYDDAKRLAKAEKWISKNFDTFCNHMRLIMEKNPQKYGELCTKFRTNLNIRPVGMSDNISKN